LLLKEKLAKILHCIVIYSSIYLVPKSVNYGSGKLFQAQRNYLMKELITWKDYEIQIAAYNNMGIGVFSEGVKIKTREGGTLCCLQFLARLLCSAG
jgi:hypothetical protein